MVTKIGTYRLGTEFLCFLMTAQTNERSNVDHALLLFFLAFLNIEEELEEESYHGLVLCLFLLRFSKRKEKREETRHQDARER